MPSHKQLSKATKARRTVEYWDVFCLNFEYILTDLSEEGRAEIKVSEFQNVWEDIRDIADDQVYWCSTMRQSHQFKKAVEIISSCISVNKQAKLDAFDMNESDYKFLSLLAMLIYDKRQHEFTDLKMMDLYDHHQFKSLFEDRKRSRDRQEKKDEKAGLSIFDVLSAFEFNTWMLIALVGICIQISILTWVPAAMMFDSLFGDEGMNVSPYAGVAARYNEEQGVHVLNSKALTFEVFVAVIYAIPGFGNFYEYSRQKFLLDTSTSDWVIVKDGQKIPVTFDKRPKNLKQLKQACANPIRTTNDCGAVLTSYFSFSNGLIELTTYNCHIYDPKLDDNNEDVLKTERVKHARDITYIGNHIGPCFLKYLTDKLLEFFIWMQWLLMNRHKNVYDKHGLIIKNQDIMINGWMDICPFTRMWMADYELFQYTHASIRTRNWFTSFIPSIFTVFSNYYIWFNDGDNKFFVSISQECMEIRNYLSQFSMKVLVLGARYPIMPETALHREYTKGVAIYQSVGMCWQFRWFMMVGLKLLISVWYCLGLFVYSMYTIILTFDYTVGSNSELLMNTILTCSFGLALQMSTLKFQYAVAKYLFKKIQKYFWLAWKSRSKRKKAAKNAPGLFKLFVDAIHEHKVCEKCFTFVVVSSVFCEHLISSRAYFVLFHESVYAWAGVTCLLAWYTYKNSKTIDRAKCFTIAFLYMLTPIMSCLPGFNPPGIENGGTNAWSISISYYLFHFGFLTCNGWVALCLKALYLFNMQRNSVQHR